MLKARSWLSLPLPVNHWTAGHVTQVWAGGWWSRVGVGQSVCRFGALESLVPEQCWRSHVVRVQQWLWNKLYVIPYNKRAVRQRLLYEVSASHYIILFSYLIVLHCVWQIRGFLLGGPFIDGEPPHWRNWTIESSAARCSVVGPLQQGLLPRLFTCCPLHTHASLEHLDLSWTLKDFADYTYLHKKEVNLDWGE